MRRRYLIAIVVAVVAAAALTVGLVSARAGQTTNLPTLTPTQLLFRMATTDHQNTSLSGDITWTNDLFGGAGAVDTSGMGPAQSPLLSSGSGRVWIQSDGLRLESQGSGGDQIAIVNKGAHTAWTYDSTTNAVTEYKLPTGQPGAGASPEPSPTGTFGPADITRWLEQMAPTAKVDVAGQTSIAGRDAYLLTMTPTATDTALGRVEVAIDGQTYIPLRLQVFPKGSDKATLSFAFSSISYGGIDAKLFTFTPPAGAKVTTRDLAAQMAAHQPATADQQKGAEPVVTHKEPQPLTVSQAQAKVGFTLQTPQGYEGVRPFQGAWTLDQAQIQAAIKAHEQAQPSTGGGPSGQQSQIDWSKLPQQAAMFQYGKGFGAIWLVEAPTTPEVTKQLARLPGLFQTQPAGGTKVKMVPTPLGSVAVWQSGDLTLAAGGMVTSSDLSQLIQAVQ